MLDKETKRIYSRLRDFCNDDKVQELSQFLKEHPALNLAEYTGNILFFIIQEGHNKVLEMLLEYHKKQEPHSPKKEDVTDLSDFYAAREAWYAAKLLHWGALRDTINNQLEQLYPEQKTEPIKEVLRQYFEYSNDDEEWRPCELRDEKTASDAASDNDSSSQISEDKKNLEINTLQDWQEKDRGYDSYSEVIKSLNKQANITAKGFKNIIGESLEGGGE